MSERWLVAMSGGVDSSVSAALLVEAGVEAIGVTMDLGGAPAGASAPRRSAACCGLPEVEDARRVAQALGMRHYTANLRDAFRAAVIEPFAAEYQRGRTPIPCVACNRTLKFDVLMRRADALGARGVATGHYARIAPGPGGGLSLFRGRDRGKDQSYFLFDLPAAVLERVRFPLAELDKSRVRALARRFALATSEKPESQGICFVPDGDVRGALERIAPEPGGGPGPIVDGEGRVLGTHPGARGYTVGQRRGLGLGGGPWYVREVDVASNRILVERDRSQLERPALELERAHWIDGEPPRGPVRVQVRHRHAAARARVDSRGAALRVDFEEPVWAPAPGQAAVVYDEEDRRVLGGGWIRGAL